MLKKLDVNRIRRSLAQGAYWRLGLATLLVALLAMGSGAPATAQSASPDGLTPDSPGWVTPPYNPWLMSGSSGAGGIYVGAIPPGAASKPVLVFVAGKSGRANDWWENTNFSGHNDMYEYAYNYGYRTAFVNLWDANGRYWGGSMWENGQMLRNQFDIIANYFGVATVNVVAHSKGGVDTQAAIVHYGAGPRVQKLITLDTPHWGTQTADLAYSTPLWWVGAVIGDLTNASYVMQTGYMNYFRSVTDTRWENGYTYYYTTAGTDWGSGALWWSGLFLSAWGSNDGLVTVSNSQLPWQYSAHVRTSALNHDNVRMGSRSMSLINSYLSTNWRNWMGAGQAEDKFNKPEPTAVAVAPGKPEPTAVAVAPGKPEPTAVAVAPGKPEPTAVAVAPGKPEPTAVAGAETTNPTAHVATSSILRGGPLAAKNVTTDQITVETGATSLSLDLISNVADLALTWTAPNGKQYTAQSAPGTGEFFSNAYHYVVTVDAPPAGTWRVNVRNTTDTPAAYGVVANVTSPVTVALDRDPAQVFAPGSKLPISLSATDANGRAISNLHVAGSLRLTDGTTQGFTVPAGRNAAQATLDLPSTAGVANLTFTVTGQLSDGSAFERTLVTSVAVVGADGKLPIPTATQAKLPTQH